MQSDKSPERQLLLDRLLEAVKQVIECYYYIVTAVVKF